MTLTVLYPEPLYDDQRVEDGIFGPGVKVLFRPVERLADLSAEDCAAADGLMIFRHQVHPEDLALFPKLKAIVRMGVGYDRLPRAEAAVRNITICNVPDYGTAEVCDHAMALMLALRRGIALHHDLQREGAPWRQVETPLVRRMDVQGLGIIGIGRIGTAVALRAKAFGMQVGFYDPYVANGVDRSLGITRYNTLNELLRRSDVLSIHAPLTPETHGMIGAEQLARLPQHAVLINTARGPIVDINAMEAALRMEHLAGVGLDVVPVEPPVDPMPTLLRAYHAREKWLEGRLIVTPHSAFHTPEAWQDIRVKSAETMRAALVGSRPQNVIAPDSY